MSVKQSQAATIPDVKRKDHTDEERPGPYMPIAMYIRYGENKELVLNPNAGFASVMDLAKKHLQSIGVHGKEHVELCDEQGRLLNQHDFPRMMFLTNFIKPGAEEATFIPARVERDEHRRLVKVEFLLKDFEHAMPELYAKVKREYHNYLVGSDGKLRHKKAGAEGSANIRAEKGQQSKDGKESEPVGTTQQHKPRHSKERSREERKRSQQAKIRN